MTTQLNFAKDLGGYNSFARAPSTDIYSATLVASTHSTITVPSNFNDWIAYFSYGSANVWVAINGTAAVPVAGTFASSTSERNPPILFLKAGDVIDIISAGTAVDVSVALYATQ